MLMPSVLCKEEAGDIRDRPEVEGGERMQCSRPV